MLRILLLFVSFIICFSVLKAKHNTVKLVYLKDSAFEVSVFSNVKHYKLIRKKKVNYIKLFFVDSQKILPLKEVFALVYKRPKRASEDTFLIREGLFSLPFKCTLIAGDINKQAVFNKRISLYLIYAFFYWERYYLTERQQVVPLRSKKYAIRQINNPKVKANLASSKRSMDWFLHKDKHSSKVRLLSLYEADK